MLKIVLQVGAKKCIQKLSHLGPRHEVPNETAFVDYYSILYTCLSDRRSHSLDLVDYRSSRLCKLWKLPSA